MQRGEGGDERGGVESLVEVHGEHAAVGANVTEVGKGGEKRERQNQPLSLFQGHQLHRITPGGERCGER